MRVRREPGAYCIERTGGENLRNVLRLLSSVRQCFLGRVRGGQNEASSLVHSHRAQLLWTSRAASRLLLGAGRCAPPSPCAASIVRRASLCHFTND